MFLEDGAVGAASPIDDCFLRRHLRQWSRAAAASRVVCFMRSDVRPETRLGRPGAGWEISTRL